MFVWSHEDMLDIDPNIMVHRLNGDPSFRLVKKKALACSCSEVF